MELENELRKILESVKMGEITPEDGKKLIEVLFDSENFHQSQNSGSKSETVFNKLVEIKSGERVIENMSIIRGKLVVEGELIGDISLVESEIFISGQIIGNLNCVRSKLFWNGGILKGNCNAVMCEDVGSPNVTGNYDHVSINLPLLDKLIPNFGSFTNKFTEKFGEDVVIISGKYSEDIISHDKVLIKGEANIKGVKCEDIFVEGTLKVEHIKCEHLEIQEGGVVEAEKISADDILNRGIINSFKIIAETIENYGQFSCERVSIEEIRNFGNFESQVLNAEEIFNKESLKVYELEAGEVENRGVILAHRYNIEFLTGYDIVITDQE